MFSSTISLFVIRAKHQVFHAFKMDDMRLSLSKRNAPHLNAWDPLGFVHPFENLQSPLNREGRKKPFP